MSSFMFTSKFADVYKRQIYDIGREDAKREVIEITPLDIPDFIQADTLTDSKIREMEEFFNQFNNCLLYTSRCV